MEYIVLTYFKIVGPEGLEPPCNQLRFQLVMSESRYGPVNKCRPCTYLGAFVPPLFLLQSGQDSNLYEWIDCCGVGLHSNQHLASTNSAT
jgi:hypothetical protein